MKAYLIILDIHFFSKMFFFAQKCNFNTKKKRLRQHAGTTTSVSPKIQLFSQLSRIFSMFGTTFSRFFVIGYIFLANFQYGVQCSRKFSLFGTTFPHFFNIGYNRLANVHDFNSKFKVFFIFYSDLGDE